MERVQELIDKLWKQNQQQEGPQSLLSTVQQLHEALSALVRTEAPKGTGKVSVVLPPKRRIATVAVAAPQPPADKPAPAIAEVQAPAAELAEVPATEQSAAPVAPSVPESPQPEIPEQHKAFAGIATPAETETLLPIQPAPEHRLDAAPVRQPYTLHKPAAAEAIAPAIPLAAPEPEAIPVAEPGNMPDEVITPEPQPVALPPMAAPQPTLAPEPQQEREVFHLHFDISEEAPTLTQQYAQQPKELHELIGQKGESLNDRLKQERPELGSKLKEIPIKDLRKAIGLNDKFLFVKELFRGDEAMYERSIKTINNFHILPEAEYWISRELKVKLGWDDSSDAAQAFYQLVRRRFA